MTMRSNKKFLKRALALLLSALMLVSSFSVVSVIAQTEDPVLPGAVDDGKWHGSDAELVAGNYEFNEYEKAILANTGLVGNTHSVYVPTDADTGYVTVDAEAQKVTAKPYATDNGYVWLPTAAVIKYNVADGTAGTDVPVTLNKVGDVYEGTFVKPANSYRVEVTYSLYIAVDEDLQELLIQTPYLLVDGYHNAKNDINLLTMAVTTINGKMEELRALYNGISYNVSYDSLPQEFLDRYEAKYGTKFEDDFSYSCQIALPEGPTKQALGNLIADYDQPENNKRLTLSVLFEAYNNAPSKIQYMVQNGEVLKDAIRWFTLQLVEIKQSDLEQLAKDLNDLADPEGGENSIAGALAMVARLIEVLEEMGADGIKEAVDTAADAAKDKFEPYKDLLGEVVMQKLYLDSLKGKTRDDLYAALAQKHADFLSAAVDVETTLLQQVINTAADTAAEKFAPYKDLLGDTIMQKLYLDSLKGKGRENNAIYTAIEQKRADFLSAAVDVETTLLQQVINSAADAADEKFADYADILGADILQKLSLNSLKGKGRENGAIYTALEAKRADFLSAANDIETATVQNVIQSAVEIAAELFEQYDVSTLPDDVEESLDLRSLLGLTKENNAIYDAIAEKKEAYLHAADVLDADAASFELFSQSFAKQLREAAAVIRSAEDGGGIYGLNTLESAIREVYDAADTIRSEGEGGGLAALNTLKDAIDEIFDAADTIRSEGEGGGLAALNTLKGAVDEIFDAADTIRSEGEGGGINALNQLESAIREAYKTLDDTVAEIESKKATIEEMGTTAQAKADEINKLLKGESDTISWNTVVSNVKSINNSKEKWNFINYKFFRDGITQEEYIAIEQSVAGAINSLDEYLVEERNFDVKPELLAYQTVLSGLVEQQVVHVVVNATVIPKNSENSDELVALETFTIDFPMDKGTSAADVMKAINNCGIEKQALAQWDSYYKVGAEYYDRYTFLRDMDAELIEDFTELDQDIRYGITFVPKSYVVTETYKPEGERETTVHFGYNWVLEKPTDPTKSYDYKVNGTAMREGEIVRVAEDLEITRTLGKAIAGKNLPQVLAASIYPGGLLTAKEKAILNIDVFYADKLYFRTPETSDMLTEVVVDGDGYRVEAKTMDAGLLGSDAKWLPVKAYPVTAGGNGSEFVLTENGGIYTGYFETDVPFTSVQVVYQLAIAGLGDGLISDFANIGATLVQDTAEQQATLDSLCKGSGASFYTNLEQVNATILGSVKSAVEGISPEAIAAVNTILNECVNTNSADGYTYLYEYLTQYLNDGLSYFYKGDNAAKFQYQIDMINQYLPVVWNDPAVQEYIVKAGFADKTDGVERVIAQLKTTELKPINALVNTNSAFIDNLLAAVAAEGQVGTYNNLVGTIRMQQILSASAPGQTAYAVEVQVLDKNGNVVDTYKEESFAAQGNPVDPQEFVALYNKAMAKVPNAKYYNVEATLPEQEVVLGKDPYTVVATLSPVTYTVKIDGTADQILYAFDAYTITLPGTGDAGKKYVYDIAGKKVEVGSGSVENYALGTEIATIDALFGADRELVITRELVDINVANLLAFAGKLNDVFAKCNLPARFIAFEDADGNMSFVLRVTGELGDVSAEALMGEIMGIVQDLSYVGINNSPLFGLNSENELKLYLQTLVNMMVNSNLGLDTFDALVDANGNIIEMAAPGNRVALDGAAVANADQLGGKLMETTIQFGANINNATSAPLYITFQDYDKLADQLLKAKKGANQIRPYLDVKLDGSANVTLNAPDSVYAYLLTALLAVGQVDFDTLQTYELDAIFEYAFGLIKPAFEAEGASADTFINTVKNTGFFDAVNSRFDMEAHKALMNTVYNAVKHVYSATELEGSSSDGTYSGVFSYDALDVLFGKVPSIQDFTAMIAETETGLSLPITFTLGNRNTEYDALVLDIRADGILNKFYMARNLATTTPALNNTAVVVLVDDVVGDLVFNNSVFVNLNGYTVHGNITAKSGEVTIVDSTLDTKAAGTVTGHLFVDGGTFALGGGNYIDDVSALLRDGYELINGTVTNGCYTMVKDGQNLNIYLGSDYIALNKSVAKVLATDLMFKLVMNYYGLAELAIDGNEIYAVNLPDITADLKDRVALVNKVLDCFNCQGSTAFANQFVADITDFAALADAVESNGLVASYTIQQSLVNPYAQYEPEDHFSLNIGTTDDKKVSTINVYVADEFPAGVQAQIVDILRELDVITTFNTLEFGINDISYGEGDGFNVRGFYVDAYGTADVLLDLTTNVNYPVVLAAILANNAKGARRTELVDAIKNYQTSNSTVELQSALEKMSIAEMTTALKASANRSLASILAGLQITAPEAVELEAIYATLRQVAARVLARVGKTGPSDKTLGGLKMAGTVGSYGINVSRGTVSAKLELRLFTEERAIIVKDKNGIIVMNTDDLAAVLENVKDGYTIYVNSPVTLAKDITLPAVEFTLEKAENIDFAGKLLWFNNGNTVMTTDKDLSGNVMSDAELFCSAVGCTKDGDMYIFRLLGDQHSWVEIPPVEPGCDTPGYTAGEWCEHCHKYVEGKEPVEISPTGHDYHAVVTPPTCTEPGYTTYTCHNSCGDSYKADYTNPTNHEGASHVVKGYDATCTEPGLTDGVYCDACETWLVPQEPIEAHHTPEAYEKEPTCTEDGVTGATKCEVCGDIIEPGTVIPATGHDITLIEGTPATCDQPGLTSGVVCSKGDHVYIAQEVIPPLGHNIVTDYGYEADCDEPGLTDGSHCDRCGEILEKQEYVAPLGHNIVIDPSEPATENSTGLTEGSHCDRCGETIVPQQTLQKLPYIHVPTVNVDPDDGIVRGAKVDADNKQVYLDVNPKGFTAKEFGEVYFQIDNATVSKVELFNYNGSVKRGDDDLICTGDIVTVWATNADGVEVSVTYTIIMMGDVNCDGKTNSRDTLLMELGYVGDLTIDGVAAKAADMNHDGKLNSRDTLIGELKYVSWADNQYTSQTKND